MFKISFQFLDKTYTGTVQKISLQSVQYIVFGITPLIRIIPVRLIYLSNPVSDQLVYQSFNTTEHKVLRLIGESIFLTCYQHKIKVHE